MTLQRLVLDFRTVELVVRCLYRTEGEAGPNTKARRRRGIGAHPLRPQRRSGGLREACGRCGTSGFTTREDIVLCTAKGDARLGEHKTVPKGA
jgi:hypothetical protein